MKKFKSGDRIKIKSWEEMKNEFGLNKCGNIEIIPCFSKQMKHLCGRIAIIDEVENLSNFTSYTLKDWNDSTGAIYWTYSADMFNPLTARDTNFKTGDKIRIRSWEDMQNEFGIKKDTGSINAKFSFTNNMRNLCGRTAKIELLKNTNDSNVKKVFLNNWSNDTNTNWSFSTDMIEKVEEEKFTINTYREGNKVISVLKNGEEIIKTAEAKCCPTDTFDFNIGAKLSLERLFEEKKEEIKNVYIKLLTTGGYSFNKKGDVLKAYKIDENNTAYVLTKDQIRSIEEGDCESEDWTYLEWEYEILKDYSPVKEVKRKAKVGEYIKLIKKNWGFNEVGDILKVSSLTNEKSPLVKNGDHPRGGSDKMENEYLWGYYNESDYVVLENYKPEKDIEENAVKAGDYIQLLKKNYSFDKIGMVLKVNEVIGGIVHILPESYPEGSGVYYNSFVGKDGSWGYEKDWYKVLKDYVPPKQNKGRDLIGRKIEAGTRFKVINVEPHRENGYVCLDEYIDKTAKFECEFTFTENGFYSSGIFDKEYMNAIDKENGSGLCWRWDEVEILD